MTSLATIAAAPRATAVTAANVLSRSAIQTAPGRSPRAPPGSAHCSSGSAA